MRLTPNEVALITSGLTTFMALVTVVVTRRNTRDTLQHQRELAHDERVWHERAALYLDLLDWVQRQEAHVTTHLGNPDLPAVLQSSDEEVRDNHRRRARVHAYASDEVKGLEHEMHTVLLAMVAWNGSLVRDGRWGDIRSPEYEHHSGQVKQHREALVGQIRRELRLDT
ncbi:hypothetical protein GCM10022254_76210 [Actinomadura meridiana]|uniref:Secreted protein n=1 Tax=Actinomadura meridiana TaxID=559626 RepID=A0ABP8CRP8_9ACTN